MERSQILEAMGELKLYGMRGAYDEIVATAVKRQHEPQMRIPRKMGIDSTRSWARIPRYRGRPFHASGGLADWVMESVLTGRVKRFGCGSPLPQAFSGECQAVSVMNEAVEDRVGECRVADGLVPVLDRQLAGDDRRAAPVAVLEDLEQVAPFG